MEDARNLVWIDLEMTGLGPGQVILEIATIVTDGDLNVLAEGPSIAIKRTPEELARMEDWSARHHEESGLLGRVRSSKIDIAEAQRLTLEFVKRWAPERSAPLCGNSVWVDRRFLRDEMPELESYLHYRMIDVSSFKEVVARWYPESVRAPEKSTKHLAMDDIRESVEELRWYRENVFRPAGESGGQAQPRKQPGDSVAN